MNLQDLTMCTPDNQYHVSLSNRMSGFRSSITNYVSTPGRTSIIGPRQSVTDPVTPCPDTLFTFNKSTVLRQSSTFKSTVLRQSSTTIRPLEIIRNMD